MSKPVSDVSVAVVIPSYRVKAQILGVISSIGPEVQKIYVVDDACPEQSGEFVRAQSRDPRVEVLFNEKNLGVGGAMIAGYRRAIADGVDYVVKMDGDGQMDAKRISALLFPLVTKISDYTKGNRFYRFPYLRTMPWVRIFGNAVLNFFSKVSSGLYAISDPTNGFTAISTKVLGELSFEKLSNRYFFESDMLYQLASLGAVVWDVPMPSRYGEEKSSMRVGFIVPEFLIRHSTNLFKRICYQYFLRDFTVASVQLVLAIPALVFGAVFGGYHWWRSYETGVFTPTGTVILAAFSVAVGIQLFLGFLSFDMADRRTLPLQCRLPDGPR